MSHATYATVERIIITLMLLGIAGMFQPFSAGLYRYGFLLLLVSTFAFIIFSHLSPRAESGETAGPVSVHDAVEREQGHQP